MDQARRSFFKKAAIAGGSLLAAAGSVGAYGYAVEPRLIRDQSYSLVTKKWPSSYSPLKLVAAGDFHVGCPSVNLKALDGIVDKLNASDPDIIVLLGDFLIRGVMGGTYMEPKDISKSLSRLKAPLGVYSVLGNHDWWKDGEGMWTSLEQAGIKVLENDSVKVASNGGTFWISGLADDTTRTPDIPKTLAKVTDDAPVIMLSHDPATFLEMPERPVVTLCGHTHGGQVAIPFWGPIIIPGRAPLKYAYGHIAENNRDLIVTSGLGTSILPVRFNRRPELVSLQISGA